MQVCKEMKYIFGTLIINCYIYLDVTIFISMVVAIEIVNQHLMVKSGVMLLVSKGRFPIEIETQIR